METGPQDPESWWSMKPIPKDKKQEAELAEAAGEHFKEKIKQGGGSFSETIPAEFSAEDYERIMLIIKDVQEKNPELIFDFEKDNNGKLIKYTVSEVKDTYKLAQPEN